MNGVKLLVVGYGSIGQRHARQARLLGCDVAIVSRREAMGNDPTYPDLASALAGRAITHAIIANETSAHWSALAALRGLGFQGPVLVEKPLAADLHEIAGASEAVSRNVWVAYNLRFHPALARLKARIAGQQIVNTSLVAGQHLPSWRPSRDYAASYSAQRALGGGVLRDLSHELDYLLWIFGHWQRVAAIGGHHGPLPIESDDCWSMVVATQLCPSAVVQLDYYNRPGTRRVVVNTAAETIDIDLMRGDYSDADGKVAFALARDETYRLQLEHFLADMPSDRLCPFAAGVDTMRLIEAAERAASSRKWVEA